MAAPAVVDELQLAGPQGELAAEVRVQDGAGHRIERGPRLRVHLRPRRLVAGRDGEVGVAAAEIGPQREDGEEDGLRFVRPEVTLPVLVEGAVEALEQRRVLREKDVVDRAEAHEAARPALAGRAEAEQADVVRRRAVEGVVDVRRLRDVGAEPAHADALLHAGVRDLQQDPTVEGLHHGPADHACEQPEHGLDLRAARRESAPDAPVRGRQLLDRDPVHHGDAGTLVQALPHFADQVPTRVELVVRGVEQVRGYRIPCQRAGELLDLVEAARGEGDPPVALVDRAPGPGPRAGDRLADHGRRRVPADGALSGHSISASGRAREGSRRSARWFRGGRCAGRGGSRS